MASEKLRLIWSKKENDFIYHYPKKSDGWLLHGLLKSDEWVDFQGELEKRGYDIKTIKLEVTKKANQNG